MSDCYRLEYSKAAQNDLEDILLYLSNVSMDINFAREKVRQLLEGVDSLDQFPHRHALMKSDRWNALQIRLFPIMGYNVLYSVDDYKLLVKIFRILYGGCDLDRVRLIH